jgi:hypothetical protein
MAENDRAPIPGRKNDIHDIRSKGLRGNCRQYDGNHENTQQGHEILLNN